MVAAAVGCSPDARPVVADSARPTSAPSPTPSVTPSPSLASGSDEVAGLPDGVKPTRPAALDGPATLAGAEAVLGYWLQLLTYAQQVGDTTETKQLSHPDCVYCSSMNGAIDELISRAGHSEGGGVAVSDVSGSEVTPGAWFAIRLTLVEEPSREVTASGMVTKRYDERKTYAIDAAVVHENGEWKIREVSYDVVARETTPASAP
nr:DUF6318 family protein [Cellulomonas sp. H30R-01]